MGFFVACEILLILTKIGQKRALLMIGLELDEEGLVFDEKLASKELDCTALFSAGVVVRLSLVLGTCALMSK